MFNLTRCNAPREFLFSTQRRKDAKIFYEIFSFPHSEYGNEILKTLRSLRLRVIALDFLDPSRIAQGIRLVGFLPGKVGFFTTKVTIGRSGGVDGTQ